MVGMSRQCPSPPLMRVSEVASELGLSRARVYEMVAEGLIPSTRIGPRCIRIPRSVWEAWKTEHVDRAIASLRNDRRPAGKPGAGLTTSTAAAGPRDDVNCTNCTGS